MATNFPTSLDSFTNPQPTDHQNSPSHSTQHTNENDAIAAIEAKVGINSSAVTTSLDYKLKNTASIDPGHHHTDSSLDSLAETKLTTTDNTTNNVSSTKHGFQPKSPADATKFLNGAATPDYTLVKDSDLSTSDITTNDVSSTKHGFTPKSPADATKFLNGAATPAYALVKDSDLSTSDITTNNASSTKHGFMPKSPSDATKFLNGAATPAFAQVKDSDLSTSDITTNDVSTSKHGFAPKLPNDSTKFLDGTGAYSTPSSGGFTSRVRAQRATSNQTITNDGNPAKVQFNQEDYDGASEFDPSTNYRFTATNAGYYLITSQVSWSAAFGATSSTSIRIYKNGSEYSRSFITVLSASRPVLQIQDILSLSASDYIEIYVDHDNSINLSVVTGRSWLNIHRLS